MEHHTEPNVVCSWGEAPRPGGQTNSYEGEDHDRHGAAPADEDDELPKAKEAEPTAADEEEEEKDMHTVVRAISSAVLQRSYTVSTADEAYTVYELEVASDVRTVNDADASVIRRHRVGKRYRDLHALHCHLEKTQPALKLPAFPFRIKMLTLDLDGLKRRKTLADYIKFVGSHPQLADDATLINFLHDVAPPAPVVLRVTALRAMGIATPKSGVPDAFCRLTMYDSTFKRIGQAYRTLTAENGRSFEPQWQDQECCFELPPACTGVTLSLWHHNMVFADVFLGRICLERHTMPRNKSVEHWFPLHPTNEASGVVVTGAIQLRVDFKTDLKEGLEMEPVEESELSRRLKQQQLEERTAHRIKREKLYSMGQIRVRYLYHPPQGHWEGYLQIEVMECRNLAAKASCYVQLHLQRGSDDSIAPEAGKEGEQKKQKKRDIPEMELGVIEGQTGVSKSSTAPQFNKKFHFFLYPTASSSPTDVPDCVKLSLWSRVIFGSDKLLGDHTLVLSDWEPGVWHDQWVTVCSPLAGKSLPTRMGRSMAREGLVPKYPIVLLPGLASSSLQVEQGNPEWVGEWIWLSLAKIGSQKFKTLFSSPTASKRSEADVSPEEGKADAQFRNEWVQHVCLMPDGCSDPPGIRVRAVPGKDGCAYLSPGALTNNLSYVMGPLIENLHEFGYTVSDLVALPYDWRLPPHMLEERDGYFTQLRQTIEKTSERCQSPVVIVAHSMGNRVLQYFLHMVVETEGDVGQRWIDKHVHSYVAVGAPFLGAPKIIRSLATGERMGMEALLRQEEGVAFLRSLGSAGMIMPVAQHRYFDVPREFVYMRGEDNAGELVPLSIPQTLDLAGASNQVANLAAYYLRNSVWRRITKAPPVKRLFAIYGVNLDTEMFYFYRHNRKGELVFDRDAAKDSAKDFQGFSIRDGIGYETKETVQSTLRSSTGLHGCRSGDATVPYASLNYCTEWREELELRVEELEGVEHREILNNRLFFRLLIEHVSEPLALRQRRERATVVLERIDDDHDDQAEAS